MRISAGISGSVGDRDVLAWCVMYAEQGDRVRLVHVYEKRSGLTCGWLQATRANTDRWEQATKLLAATEKEFLAKLADLAIPTRTSVTSGALADVLTQEAGRADMLVVGAGHREWPDLLRGISFPVVVVPAGWGTETRRGRNVVVLAGRELPVTAIDLAVSHARRTGMEVLVIQRSFAEEKNSDRDDLVDTAQAEQLDTQLASWAGADAPPIVTEVRNDAPLEQLHALAATLGLVVVPLDSGSDDTAILDLSSAIRSALGELKIPVLVVPAAPSSEHPAPPNETREHDPWVVPA